MKKIIQIIIGNVLMAFAISTLILDNSIVAGGVSGISTVFHFYTGISISLCVGIINIALFIIGFCFLGKTFAMKTLISTFLFPILLEFFNQQPYLHGLLNDQLLICILGGFLLGLGIGLVLKAGGSTGGFDILALIVEKYFKVPVTLLVNGIDAAILVLQISFHSAPEIVYGIMTILITAYMMNYLLSSGDTTLRPRKKTIVNFHSLLTIFAGSLCLIYINTINQLHQHRTVQFCYCFILTNCFQKLIGTLCFLFFRSDFSS